MVAPEVVALGAQLAQVVARNAAAAVVSRVNAIRARKVDESAINEMTEVVNDLIADKNELIAIATALEQELVAQRISEQDITYITTELLPVVEDLTKGADDSEAAQVVTAIKSIVSVETLTIMQLIGFNFRRAIGEPLTTLVEQMILAQLPSQEDKAELSALELRQQTAYLEAIQDPEARAMLQKE